MIPIMEEKAKRVPALQRGLDIIELLASSKSDMSFSEILSVMKIPRPSLARILKVLTDRGLLHKTDTRGRYRLGMRLLYLGNRLESKFRLRTVAWPHMKNLAEKTGKTIELCILDKDQLVLIEQVEGDEGVRLYSRIGSAYPYFHAVAAGKIYLAHMEIQKMREVLNKIGLPRVTGNTITEMDRLDEELRATLKDGYAFEDQELREGVRRVGSPIYEHHGDIAGCIVIASTILSFKYEDSKNLGNMVREAAKAISADIGSMQS